MSPTELLLLAAFFILLPLVQQLLTASRKREGQAPEGVRAQPAPARLPEELLPEETQPQPPEPARVEPPAARRERRPRTVIADVRGSLNLRRAMVLTTILGPCRALDPHSGPDAPSSRP